MGTARYLLCGAVQLLIFLGYVYLAALMLTRCYEWISDAVGLADVYMRSLAGGGAVFAGLCVIPILVKWVVVGRWKPGAIRVWTLAYVRFWAVKTLVRGNPLVLFAGSPVYILYLRALGAKIGAGVTIFSKNVPVCTDLLAIGRGTVIRKDALFSCYRARAGLIETGPVTLGEDAYVGEATVIDIGAAMGDRAQLGHASCLQPGQSIPAGRHWHGSPAQATATDYRTVEPARCGTPRRLAFGCAQLLSTLALRIPLATGGTYLLATHVPALAKLMDGRSTDLTAPLFYQDALVLSAVLFFGTIITGLLFIVTVPRVLNPVLTPGRVYPLYGFGYWAQRTISRLTNSPFYNTLFGDSSYIVHYLRWLGYDLGQIEQTGSNFGVALKHETPYLVRIGSGTMVSDGLSIMNADFSNTSFRITGTSIGARTFIGNDVTYPAQSRVGDNCLLATKVMIPIDGHLRRDVGLLGSPCFEIPRSVRRDTGAPRLNERDRLRRLAAKNRHNFRTVALYLLVAYVNAYTVTLLAMITAALYPHLGTPVIAAGVFSALLVNVAYFILTERAIAGFRPLRPRSCSIYDPYYWWHERFWKIGSMGFTGAFNGTPYKNVLWRLQGVRLGRRLFDDGCAIPEKSLVIIGDDCTFAEATVIQAHSLEEGVFKSDHVRIGNRCTLGTKAFVHYGVLMGDDAILDPDSFLMKGEEIAPHARWRGNPATQLQAPEPHPETPTTEPR